MQLSIDQASPALLWIADNTPRTWFGHLFPGDIIAGDNPDNSNRVTYLDGGSSYELVGRYGSPQSGQFHLNIEMDHPNGGMGRSEERRVGQEGVRTCESRWSPDHS